MQIVAIIFETMAEHVDRCKDEKLKLCERASDRRE